MRILFMGSAELACPSLRMLLSSPRHQVVGVVTQPDRPKGRHQQVACCAVKAFASEQPVPVFTPEKISDPLVVEQLRALEADLIVLVAYGQFLKPSVLALPRKGSINLHPSLLPKYRGAAPVHWAIARGEKVTGISIMFISEKMDAGDIILQEEAPILDNDTAGSMEHRLAERGAEMVLEAVDLIENDRAPRTPQDERLVTLAPKLKKEDGHIHWTLSAEELQHRIRGFNPWPCCFCEYPGKPGEFLKILSARVESASGLPGEVLTIDGDGPVVAAGFNALRLLEVQPPGKKPMSGAAWLRGHPLKAGEFFK
ncbi:MAG: methionyl-tRNA formyltransferase [Lentisphaerota bacterium]